MPPGTHNHTANVQRWLPDWPFPPYTYVPGSAPHPISDPKGHRLLNRQVTTDDFSLDRMPTSTAYRYAIDLFHYGYYWEAHEVWETLWHGLGRRGVAADFVKALIKLAAAGVKAREGRPVGISRHAKRCAALLQRVERSRQESSPHGPEGRCAGIQLTALLASAHAVASQAEALAQTAQRSAQPVVLYDFLLVTPQMLSSAPSQ